MGDPTPGIAVPLPLLAVDHRRIKHRTRDDSSDGRATTVPPRYMTKIEVTTEPIVSWAKRHRVLRLPVIRGVVALGESLKIGLKRRMPR